MYTYYVSIHICVRSPRGKALPLQTVMPYMRKEKLWRFIIAQLKSSAGGKDAVPLRVQRIAPAQSLQI